MSDTAFLRCIRPSCAATYDALEPIHACRACGDLLDVQYDWDRACRAGDFAGAAGLAVFRERWASRQVPVDHSGVWRFRELMPFARADELVTIGEGQTLLHAVEGKALDLPQRPGRLFFQYEGLNPSGSFKDNGMAAAFTVARRLGRRVVACASTGNTSASLALYAAQTRMADGAAMRAVVFIGAGKIAHGKLAQTLDHGAVTLQVAGDFDACLARIREAAEGLGLYLMNSVNPFRLEGQKAIMYRVLEGLDWQVPDWIVVPGGNLGNASAFGKAFVELKELGLVERLPRLAVVNARGANTLCELVNGKGVGWNGGDWPRETVAAHEEERRAAGWRARTVATAIEIGRPVNLPKALRSLAAMAGVVIEVEDEAILDEKARIGRCGLGCEPASAASLAGLRRLVAEQVVGADERVVCILTGHALKDPDATIGYHLGPAAGGAAVRGGGVHANRPRQVADDAEAIRRAIERLE